MRAEKFVALSVALVEAQAKYFIGNEFLNGDGSSHKLGEKVGM